MCDVLLRSVTDWLAKLMRLLGLMVTPFSAAFAIRIGTLPTVRKAGRISRKVATQQASLIRMYDPVRSTSHGPDSWCRLRRPP